MTVHMFSTSVELGGLGIPCLETTILRMRQDRLKRLMHSSDAVVRDLFKDSSQIGKNKPQLRGIEIKSKEHQRIVEAESLHDSLDGKGLKNIRSVPKINNWVNEPTLDIEGGEYIKAIKVRCNALESNSRSSRARPNSGLCSRCNKPETLGHILQTCGKSMDGRNSRHDKLVFKIAGEMRRHGFKTEVEKTVNQRGRQYKRPDIIAYKPGEVHIIDPTIVADNTTWTPEWKKKTDNYNTPKMLEYTTKKMNQLFSTNDVPLFRIAAIVLTWRGGWSKQSYDFLRSMKISHRKITLWTIDSINDSWHTWNWIKRKSTDS